MLFGRNEGNLDTSDNTTEVTWRFSQFTDAILYPWCADDETCSDQ